ncbi:TPA: hypothetical protein N0F65_006474 [Lagenidium giganteum]|uniref:Carbohydrate-binding domain-containing protein n=1 Tax=Lagenidium giganteum TaxID=4803 RepID=A0AAV2YT12_9STRA|nr:TPA: hypothetical protein N0F65_006474 [Lagenidium giganteum]
MAMAQDAEWQYMDSLRPPMYVCVRRNNGVKTEEEVEPLELDGRLHKPEWEHVPWSNVFEDIEGSARQPKAHPKTHMKMMYDDEYLYVGAEMVDEKIWGTFTKMNSTMYHENDIEVFLNPDGSRHNYYEFEMNCLNTIWELVLRKPYKDGYDIINPYNLPGTKSAVYVDGVTNSPTTKCTKWSVEVAFRLDDLVQFDRMRQRPAAAGDVWRVNFSRVHYELHTIVNKYTNELMYEKVPDTKEDNIVWSPTGVIDMHRPEKWGYVLFASTPDFATGEQELSQARESFLDAQIAMERILDGIYYQQRAFFQKHQRYAMELADLYGKDSSGVVQLPLAPLLQQYNLEFPTLRCRPPELVSPAKEDRRRRSYAPELDVDEEIIALTARRKSMIDSKLKWRFTATIKSATQEWNIEHDGRLWSSHEVL